MSDNKNGEQPAMPCGDMTGEVACGGLSKREYFAALAMQGFCAAGYGDFKNDHEVYIAELSVRQADALLNELSKPSQP